jgi:DNA-binding GntR family transcriptional regulator
MRVSQQDHEEMLAALVAGDVDRVEEAVRIHYGGLERFIRSQYLRENTALPPSEEV